MYNLLSSMFSKEVACELRSGIFKRFFSERSNESSKMVIDGRSVDWKEKYKTHFLGHFWMKIETGRSSEFTKRKEHKGVPGILVLSFE